MNESDESKGHSRTALPGTFTDVVSALREVLGLVNDFRELIGAGADALERSRRKKAAKCLGELYFPASSVRFHLERIASGDGTTADFDAIRVSLDETLKPVQQRIDDLSRYRDVLREQYGLAVIEKLDRLIGIGGRKSMKLEVRTGLGVGLRKALWDTAGTDITSMSVYREHIGHAHANQSRCNAPALSPKLQERYQAWAQRYLLQIEAFNKSIIELHDLIVAPEHKP